MRRSGFTVLELVFVIAIIGVLGTIGYKGFQNVATNANVAAVVNEVKTVNTALGVAKGQAGLTWGGTFDDADMSKVNPVEPGSLNNTAYNFRFNKADGGGKGTTNILATERSYYDEMVATFPYEEGIFRSVKIPSATIGATRTYGGKNMIIFRGVPGDVAYGVRKSLNGIDNATDKDGLTSDMPVVIVAQEDNIVINDEKVTKADNITKILPDACIPANYDKCGGVDNPGDMMTYIKNRPSVTIFYFYNNAKVEW